LWCQCYYVADCRVCQSNCSAKI